MQKYLVVTVPFLEQEMSWDSRTNLADVDDELEPGGDVGRLSPRLQVAVQGALHAVHYQERRRRVIAYAERDYLNYPVMS